MIDQGLIRKDACGIKSALERRGSPIHIKEFQKMDALCRKMRAQYEDLQAQRNHLAKSTQQSRPDEAQILKGQCLKKEAEDLKETLAQQEELLFNWLLTIPNLPCQSVPLGKTEEDNRVIDSWQEPPSFSFPIKDHVELGQQSQKLIDFEQAAEISGARFAILKGPIAKLHRAIAQFMLEMHTLEHGYEEVQPPCIVRASALLGTGQLPKFSDDLFQIRGTSAEFQEMYLIPTAEVPLTNLVANKILTRFDQPLKWVSHTLCFRSEAGSYGKDTRGLIRQHQFEKVELVQIVRPEHSEAALETLTEHAENVLKALGLPYRKVLLCTGDLGFSSAKTYDLEVWMPSQNKYREISSCSNCTDFQARRLNARYITNPTSAVKNIRLVHTLNGSGLAVGRTLCAILENYQTENGNIRIPQKLRAYFNNKEFLFEESKSSGE